MAICSLWQTKNFGTVLLCAPPQAVATRSQVEAYGIERLLFRFDAYSVGDACRKRNELMGWRESLYHAENEIPFNEDRCSPGHSTDMSVWLLERVWED